MSRRDELLAKATRLRERADALDRQITARTGDPMAGYFLLGAGGARSTAERRGASRQNAARDEKTWEMMRDRDHLRSRAAGLESTARTTVFSDDLAGLAAEVAKHERTVADCTALLADPAKVAKYGREAIVEMRSSARRKLNAARKRLERAEGATA